MYLAFDACDRELVRELADAGEMPTFRHLFDTAAVVDVVPPPDVLVSANWPSFTTALQADRHDYLCWVRVEPGTYEWRHRPPSEIKGRPFWDTVSDAGRRVAVLDVPHGRAASDGFNGYQLFEYGCHDRHFGTRSWPPSLLDTVLERVGPHPVGMLPEQRDGNFAPCDFLHRAGRYRTPDENAAWWDELSLGIDRKQAVSLDVLDEGGWDLFLSVFGEAHCAGHQAWHLHDPRHPEHDPASVARIGDPVREVYRRFDTVLAEHLTRAGDDTAVYVHLSHGMGPHFDGTHLIDIILRRLDPAEPDKRGRRSQLAAGALGRLPAAWTAGAAGAAAPLIRRRMERFPPQPNEPSPLPHADRSWFEVPNNTVVGGVRLNLRGREPHGRIDPADFDRVCDRLADHLREIVNLDTGEPMAREVVRSDSIYRRRHDDAMPDLFIRWNPSAPIERVYSPRIGTVVEPYHDWRTGDHIAHGLLFVRAPGVVPGRRPTPIRTVDVSASLAGALGVDLGDVDGRPVDDLLPSPGVDQPREAQPSHPRPAGDSRGRTLERLATEHHTTRREVERLSPLVGELAVAVPAHQDQLADHERRLSYLERLASIRSTMEWIAQADVPESVLVSVVTPTHNRSSLLPRAIASVSAQSYTRWQHVVVDDGSSDPTPEVLAKFDDERLVTLRTDGVRECAARNRGLAAATGEIIVYLDDDNVLHPDWCKAVVWAFTQRPDIDVLYGARIIDDVRRATGAGSGALPWLHFEPFDHDALTRNNFADMGVIAHRAGLREATFDESLRRYGDWDLLWRLTRDRAPLELPVVACYYSTEAEGRMTRDGDTPEDTDRLRAKFAALLQG